MVASVHEKLRFYRLLIELARKSAMNRFC